MLARCIGIAWAKALAALLKLCKLQLFKNGTESLVKTAYFGKYLHYVNIRLQSKMLANSRYFYNFSQTAMANIALMSIRRFAVFLVEKTF